MAASTSAPEKKFNTELTDYSVSHEEKTGPYADNLEVDALVVGAGFGEHSKKSFVQKMIRIKANQRIRGSWNLQ